MLVVGTNRTTHLFGRRINRHYQGKLQTILDQREAGHPVLRWTYQTSFTDLSAYLSPPGRGLTGDDGSQV